MKSFNIKKKNERARFSIKSGVYGCEDEKIPIIALAGNPNVGKSTLFNSLTARHRHTGNWSGKTVDCVCERGKGAFSKYKFADIPGTYSLLSHSEEEKIARDYIAFGGAEVTVIVCDATMLMQNLNLVLQIREMGRKTILLLNFMDEAKKRGISIDTERLSRELSVPVAVCEAHKKRSLSALLYEIERALENEKNCCEGFVYSEKTERCAQIIVKAFLKESAGCEKKKADPLFLRWAALRLIDADDELSNEIYEYLGVFGEGRKKLESVRCTAIEMLYNEGIDESKYKDIIVDKTVSEAERIYRASSFEISGGRDERSRKIDKFLTGRVSAYPLMLLLLALVFFLTLSFANYPSEFLAHLFDVGELRLREFFSAVSMPPVISSALLEGIFRTVGKVVSVMLAPMVIFFPLFALLEDSGYLPRIAYNLDRPFSKCGACGKQALTMCMGLGCNAVGITGCRIIDSRRERYIALLTNSLIPCNGRLPMLISLITVFCMFFSESVSSVTVAFFLTLFILLSVVMTFFSTAVLSHTLMRGERSSFAIELPPYRRPRFLSVIITSLVEKCISVLLRAVCVAAPMGLVIWVMAAVPLGDATLLSHAADFFDPIGRFFGMDGVIILAFILGIPANEIVIPLVLMIYSSGGAIGGDMAIGDISSTLVSSGWTPITAVCTLIFALFHWPCSTSLITVYKETRSIKYVFWAFLIPTAIGLFLCFMCFNAYRIFS